MDLTDFTSDSNSDRSTEPRFDRSEKPHVERLEPVKSDDKRTLFGFVGRDHNRDGVYVYSSPRYRRKNYYRKIGGYPIDVDVLEKLRAPPAGANVGPVELVYIIQREKTDNHPAMTVFEYDLETYLEAETISHPGWDEQKCPTLDDAATVWPSLGGLMFETGEL